jgi:flagellar hook-associated protein 2
VAGTISFGNLAGIDTASLVDSLMSLERTTQNRIKTTISSRESVLKSLQSMSTGVSSLSTKAADLTVAKGWDLFSVASSKESVSATGTTGAAAGSFSFDVVETAATHKVLYGGSARSGDVVVDSGAGKLTFTNGGGEEAEVVAVPPTLQGVIAAINGKEDLNVRAAAIDMGGGELRLQLTSTKSGADAAFSVSGFTAAMGSPAVASQGRDAVIQIGPDPVTDSIRSGSNTFTDVFPGVTFTVSAKETGVTLDVSSDADALKKQMKDFVELVNSTMSNVRTQTSYTPPTGAATKGTSGPLAGDSGVRKLGNDLRTAVFPPTGEGSMSQVGLELTQTGSLKFDENAFAKALTEDPEAARSMAMGFAERVAAAVKPAVDKVDGYLTKSISSQQSAIRDLNDRVSEWDIRLDLRRTKLEKQFTAMSVALGSLNSQSSWMSSQLSNLNKS